MGTIVEESPHRQSQVGFRQSMLSEYLNAVMGQAQYRLVAEDDCIYGEIPGFEGVNAQAHTLENCRQDLAESLEEWIFFRVSRELPVPMVNGIQIPMKNHRY
jgi:predicted RNase H-like HicB family nuclease